MQTTETQIDESKAGPAAPVRMQVRGRHGMREVPAKVCGSCGLTKLVTAYRKTPGKPGRHSADCRSCETRRAGPEPLSTGAAAETPPGCKRCARCGEARPLTCFTPDRRSRDGRYSRCLSCREATGDRRIRSMPGSLETPDELLGQNTSEKAQRIALGIAIAHATCPAGHSRSREEIAAYADVSVEAIRRIEQQALRKVRERVEELLREANVDLREVRL